MLLAVFLFLRTCNFLPLALDQRGMRRYSSLEDVERVLQVRQIILPSYFPDDIAWPPREIIAGRVPDAIIILHFEHQRTGDLIMALAQIQGEQPLPPLRLAPVVSLGSQPIVHDEWKGVLELGLCEDRKPCNTLDLRQGTHRIRITARLAQGALSKMAKSLRMSRIERL